MRTPGPRSLVPGLLCGILSARIPPVPMQSQANPPATIQLFQADHFVLKPGEPVQFIWETRDALSIRLDPPGVVVDPSGTLTDQPKASTVYWLSVANLFGGESWPLQITVMEPSPGGPGALAALRSAPAARRAAQKGRRGARAQALPGPEAAAEPGSGYWVQFAALSSRESADALAGRLGRKLGEPVTVESAVPPGGGVPLFRVHAGPYAGRTSALMHQRAARGQLEADLRPIVVEGSPPLPSTQSPAPPRRQHRHRRPKPRPGQG